MPPLSDAALVDATATVLAAPRVEPPDSFVLHAPLELLARAALLPHTSPDSRSRAQAQIVSIADRFEGSGSAIEIDDRPFSDTGGALDALVSATRDGDLDAAARAGRFLGATLDAHHLSQAVGDLLAPSLAAAAHGPIFLHHLPRSSPRSPLAGAMFGTLAREVARHPDWSLRWQEGGCRGGGDLAGALRSTPVLGPPGSNSIHPLMVQAEESGLAEEVVGGAIDDDTDPDLAMQVILRTATASMLLDDPDHAPYGWSHCLTIPQGVLSTLPTTSRPAEILAIAATHVVGFRAALASRPLDEIEGPAGPIGADALVPGVRRPDATALQAAIDFAAVHEDAHLTKYLVSCMDAARADPAGSSQHLAAAVHLADWWRAHDD
ncbi:hypothetical protein [Actinospongicola halichondriae]|uniref:hypothetical protein n=1 Tax=Actinospongicola halichondriae TaxID=3236844 RepID=UPI003D587D2A